MCYSNEQCLKSQICSLCAFTFVTSYPQAPPKQAWTFNSFTCTWPTFPSVKFLFPPSFQWLSFFCDRGTYSSVVQLFTFHFFISSCLFPAVNSSFPLGIIAAALNLLARHAVMAACSLLLRQEIGQIFEKLIGCYCIKYRREQLWLWWAKETSLFHQIELICCYYFFEKSLAAR